MLHVRVIRDPWILVWDELLGGRCQVLVLVDGHMSRSLPRKLVLSHLIGLILIERWLRSVIGLGFDIFTAGNVLLVGVEGRNGRNGRRLVGRGNVILRRIIVVVTHGGWNTRKNRSDSTLKHRLWFGLFFR